MHLSPGAHNELARAILDQFLPRWLPGGAAIYVGDTGGKWGHFDRDALSKLGVTLEDHGKIPDVVLYDRRRNWLVLVECVTSHGPVNGKRHDELQDLFRNATAGLVYVTAFPTRKLMAKYLTEIAWETEVWCAEAPSHLIHLDGERFLAGRNICLHQRRGRTVVGGAHGAAAVVASPRVASPPPGS